MEYCNSNLFEEIKMKGLLTIDQIKKYTSDLVKAIVYLH
jgi:serine/threonine protein kinase